MGISHSPPLRQLHELLDGVLEQRQVLRELVAVSRLEVRQYLQHQLVKRRGQLLPVRAHRSNQLVLP